MNSVLTNIICATLFIYSLSLEAQGNSCDFSGVLVDMSYDLSVEEVLCINSNTENLTLGFNGIENTLSTGTLMPNSGEMLFNNLENKKADLLRNCADEKRYVLSDFYNHENVENNGFIEGDNGFSVGNIIVENDISAIVSSAAFGETNKELYNRNTTDKGFGSIGAGSTPNDSVAKVYPSDSVSLSTFDDNFFDTCTGNLLLNPSFEDGLFSPNASIVDPNNAMTSPIFNGLPLDNFMSDNNIFWIEDGSRATDGDRFIYLPEGAQSGKCVIQQEALFGGSFTPCSTYEVTFDVAGFDENENDSESNYILEFFYWDADRTNGQEIVQDEFHLEGTTTSAPNPIPASSWNNLNWMRVTGTITLPSPVSADFSLIEMVISVNDGGGVLIDNVCVTKVSDNVEVIASGDHSTCSGDVPNNDGLIQILSSTIGNKYEYNTTGFDILPLTYAAASNTINNLPQVVVNNITNSTTTYYLRVYDSNGCFKDVTINLIQNTCDCAIDGQTSNLAYNDNNTPSDVTDDTFSFTVTVTNGVNPQGTWESNGQTFNYGTPVNYGPFPVDNEGAVIELFDSVVGRSCGINLGVNLSSCIYLGTCVCCGSQ